MRDIIRNLSIKYKLISLMLLTSTLALLVAAGILLANEWLTLRDNLSDDLHTLTEVLSINGSVGLAFNNREAMQQTLASLRAKSNVLFAHSFDRNGQLFASYFKSDRPDALPSELRHYYPGDLIDNGPLTEDKDFFYTSHVDIFARIIVDGSMLGTLYLRSDLEEFTRRRNHYLLVTAATSLAALLLAYILALRLQNIITGPLHGLLRTMRQVSEAQDYSLRARQLSADELGDLQAGFNAMLGKIESNNQELEKYREHLEQLVQERTREKEKAVDANQAKTRFFAAASHDLRQPLHALNWFIDLLRRRLREEENRDILAQVQHSVDAMQSLFNALLDMSKLESGVLQAERRVFALDALCQKLYAEFASQAEQKGLVLRLEAAPCYIESDPVLLERILRNLLSNACKYTEQGGITLRAQADEHTVRISVEDSGIGIPEAQQLEVFREFHQLHNPERDRAKGLGLGLSIVQGLTDLLQHPLALHSREGEGTRFTLILPRRTAPDNVDIENTVPMAAHNMRGNILLIDDDAFIRDSMGQVLRQWGHRVITSDNADEALSCLAREGFRPDLLLVDYRLRDKRTGVEAVQQIHEYCGHDIPAILITGDTLPESLQTARESGHPLLFKPVKPAQLRKLIGYYLMRLKSDA